MRKTKLTGVVLATAVAVLFAGTIANAAGDSSGAPQVKCEGGNSCKGQSACKTASSSCQGQNACKGKGWVMTASIKQCQADGGKPEQSSTK